MLRYLGLGAIAGMGWKMARWLFAPAMSGAFAAIVFFPVGEELLRALALRWAHRNQRSPDKTKRAAIGYGLGFGLWEAVLRWLSMASGAPFSATAWVGTLLPILLHVLLSLIIWLHIRDGKPFLGLVVCTTLHAAHNAYVVMLATQFTSSQFALDVLVRLLILSGAISWMMRRGSASHEG